MLLKSGRRESVQLSGGFTAAKSQRNMLKKNLGGSLFFSLKKESRPRTSYLVDRASSHMLVSKIKPCMSKYKPH